MVRIGLIYQTPSKMQSSHKYCIVEQCGRISLEFIDPSTTYICMYTSQAHVSFKFPEKLMTVCVCMRMYRCLFSTCLINISSDCCIATAIQNSNNNNNNNKENNQNNTQEKHDYFTCMVDLLALCVH